MARIVFLQRHYYEYGGPAIISAVVKSKGHKVSLLIGEKSSAFLRNIEDNDILAFSTMTGFHRWAVKIAGEVKEKRKVLTVFGGPHPTYFPEMIEHPAVDAICVGEGEYPMLDLADAVDQGENICAIPNLWVKQEGMIYRNEIRPLIESLDSLPFTDRQIYYNSYFYLKTNPLKPFLVARGCPYKCSFCFNGRLQEIYKGKGRYVRFRSPANIIEEITKVKRDYGFKTVFFADDIFVLDKRWLREFLPLYKKEVALPFTCDGRADTLDEEAIALLSDAGCFCLRFGLESGNEEIRTKILKKGITNAQIINAAGLLKKYKIKFMTYNVVGIPEETIENAYETVELNIKIGTSFPRCSILTPYPGTEIAEYAKKKELYDARPQDISASSQQFESILKSRYKNNIINLHSFFQTAVIMPWAWGFIKKLIKLPPNSLFRFWWALIYFFVFVKAEGRDFWYTCIFALHSFKAVFRRE